MYRHIIFLIGSLFLIGCTTGSTTKYLIKDEPALIEFPGQSDRAEIASPTAGIAFEDISLAKKAKAQSLSSKAVIEKETDDYIKNGTANVIVQPDNTRIYPFGLAQPQLTCIKMLFCNIVLQAGEQILDMAAGDTVRWQTKVSYVGDANHFTAVVMVKPFFGGLTTNLAIVTDRRAYNIILSSIEKGEYMPGIGFYFPQDTTEKIRLPTPPAAPADNSTAVPFDIKNVQFNYVVEGNRGLPWFPERVFDDGDRVIIKMSAAVSSSELPVFIVRNEKGLPEVVNYRFRKPYFIIDTIFKKGELILGADSAENRIVIRRK